jgi:hypothetical protein
LSRADWGADCIVTIHGENSNEKVVFLGGRDEVKVRRLGEMLKQRGFCVRAHKSPRLQGTSLANICNRGRAQAGVQIESTNDLRRSFFRSLSSKGRKNYEKDAWGIREGGQRRSARIAGQQNCDAGVTQNLPTLPKLTSLTVCAGSVSITYVAATQPGEFGL